MSLVASVMTMSNAGKRLENHCRLYGPSCHGELLQVVERRGNISHKTAYQGDVGGLQLAHPTIVAPTAHASGLELRIVGGQFVRSDESNDPGQPQPVEYPLRPEVFFCIRGIVAEQTLAHRRESWPK